MHRGGTRAINDCVAMSPEATENHVRALLHRAEEAIRSARRKDHIVQLLEQVVAIAAADSDEARLAHRHLAELRLEDSPWRAALHLRRVLQLDPDDDVAQGLMGLCHALQANFRCAVAAYRRALVLSPGNPWYSHNLGHLLDVALGAPREALPHLRRAHRIEPEQDEVAASLSHCLARLGMVDEAALMVAGLISRNPADPHLRALRDWLASGAPAEGDKTVPELLSAVSPAAAVVHDSFEEAQRALDSLARPAICLPVDRGEVDALLSTALSSATGPSTELDRAQALWSDYAYIARPVLGNAVVIAASVEYALARVDGSHVTQKDIAARRGVSIRSLQSCYTAIRAALRLQPRDQRYARTRTKDNERRPPV